MIYVCNGQLPAVNRPAEAVALTYKMQLHLPTKTFCTFLQNELAKNKHGITRIAWVNYDNRNIFYSIIKALTETQKLDDYEQAWSKANSIIYTYRDELLLVIDNVDTLEDGNLLRIADMPCRLLITSRIDKISSIKAISVDNLSTDTCVDLFLMYYKMNPAPVYYIRKIIQLADNFDEGQKLEYRKTE